MKILALDIGDVWVGTALSDSLGITCKPYQTVREGDLKQFLLDIIKKENIIKIVVGHPVTMKGEVQHQAKKVEEGGVDEETLRLVSNLLSHAQNITKKPKSELREIQALKPRKLVKPVNRTFMELATKGYNKEHTNFESQDIYHLVKLADACLKVDWENLPTVRDTKIKENLLMARSYGFEDEVDGGDYYLDFKTKRKKVKSTENSFKNDSNKKGRVFFDRGGKLEPLLKKEGAYSALKENFLISDLNKLEIEILKKQNPNFSKEDLKICDILNQLL